MKVIPFQFENNDIRVQRDERGEAWFNANDVCAALGFGNPRQALDSNVESEDVHKMDTLTAGGLQRQNHINESGLYSLILGSRLESAKRFKRWVTSVVLPQIRKTGAYSETPKTFSEALRLAADLQEQLEAARPCIEFVGRYVEAKSSKSLSDAAKVLGWKPQAFIDEMHQRGLIFKRGGCWVPYQEQIDNGRFTVKTGEANGHAYVQARLEPKGIAFAATFIKAQSEKA